MTHSTSKPPIAVCGYDAVRRLVDLLARQAARERIASLPAGMRGGAAPHYTNHALRGPGLVLSTSTCS
jgi:hypothetical protein